MNSSPSLLSVASRSSVREVRLRDLLGRRLGLESISKFWTLVAREGAGSLRSLFEDWVLLRLRYYTVQKSFIQKVLLLALLDLGLPSGSS
jgi:hypothetical protein